MAGLLPMPPDKHLTYQDLMNPLQVRCAKTVARILRGCPRFNPTHNTVRFLESDVREFILKHRSRAAKADTSPDAKPDGVKRTKRPVSASK